MTSLDIVVECLFQSFSSKTGALIQNYGSVRIGCLPFPSGASMLVGQS